MKRLTYSYSYLLFVFLYFIILELINNNNKENKINTKNISNKSNCKGNLIESNLESPINVLGFHRRTSFIQRNLLMPFSNFYGKNNNNISKSTFLENNNSDKDSNEKGQIDEIKNDMNINFMQKNNKLKKSKITNLSENKEPSKQKSKEFILSEIEGI